MKRPGWNRSRYIRSSRMRSIMVFGMFLLLSAFLAGCGGGGGEDSGIAGSSGSIAIQYKDNSGGLSDAFPPIPADGSSSVIIQAKITDSAGNPVRHFTDVTFSTTLGHYRNGGTSYTMQTQPPLDEKGWPDISADPLGIAETHLIAGVTAGLAKITVRSGNLTQSAYVTLTGGGAAITLTASPESITADGTSSTTITATLTDSTGNPVKPGTPVTFITGLGNFSNGGKAYAVNTPDATGIVTFSLIAGVVPGTTYLQATTNNVTQALSLVMTKTDPLYAGITVEANPSRIAADGKSQSVITATVTRTRNMANAKARAAGLPVSGVPITFYKITSNVESKPLPEANTYKGTGTSIAGPFYSFGGLTTFYMTAIHKSATFGEYFTVWLFNPLSGERELLINRNDWIGTLVEEKGLSLLPGNYQLEIQTSGDYEIKIVGDIGPAQTGKTVLGFEKTDADGKAAYTYTADWLPGRFNVKAETGELSNSENALSDETILTQTSGAPPVIEIDTASDSIYANGMEATSVTAQVWTPGGNKVPDGTVVSFTATSGTIDATGVTVDGLASTTLTSIASGTSVVSTVTATVGTDSASTTVTFLGVSLSDMKAEPTTIFANGTDFSTIKVRLRDVNGSAVGGESITFTTTLGSIKTVTATTDSDDGFATTQLIAPTSSGTGTVTARYGLLTATTTVSFTAEVPVGSITLAASPVTIPADGASTSTITASIKDTADTAVPKGTSVTFTTTLGSFTNGNKTYTVITPNTTGTVSVPLISSTTVGSALVIATSEGVTQSIYVGFGGAPVAIVLSADPASIWADGVSSSAIQATLTDGSGAPVVSGTSVTFTTTLGSFSNGSQTYTVTTLDSTGIVTVSLIAGTSTGSALVSATSNGVTQSVYVIFTDKGGDPFSIALAANPTSIPADGTSTSTITATLTDGAGKPVNPGISVTFSTTLGSFSNGAKVYTVTTPDATGTVAVSLIAGTAAGSAAVTATSNGVTQTVYVTFTGQVVASMTVTATPNTLPANGTSTSDIRAEVKDAQGNPIADGELISFTIISGTGTLSATSATTSGGFATVIYTASKTPGTVTIQAMAANSVSGSTTITLTSGGVGFITLTASPTSIPADGSSSSVITATVTDTTGNPVPVGTTVTFSTTLGTLSSTSVTTFDDTGIVSVSLIAGTTPGSALVTATSQGVTQTVYVGFGGAPVFITLAADPTTISADGSSSSTITATLKDAAGSPVTPGTSVTFTTNLGTFSNATQTITVITPDATGVVSVSLIAGTAAGSATVTATSNGVTQTVTVIFSGTVVASITVTATPSTLVADGTSTSTIRAEVKDAQGNPITDGESITFTVTSGTGTLSAASATTSGGFATVTYTASTTPGTETIQAMSANNVTGTVSITLTSGAVGSIILTAVPPVIPADGATSSTITATIKDGALNPVPPGTSVVFTTTLGTFSNATTTITVTTPDATGVAAVSLIAGTTPGTATVTATSTGVSQTTTVTFSSGAEPASLSLATSQVSVKSDNSDSATITATVLDVNNAAVADITVGFSASGGQISSSSGVTNPGGQAQITFSSGTTDPTNRIVTITATVGALTGSIPVQILGSTLTLTTDTTTLPDNGSDPATLTITAKNAGGVAVYNTPITFTFDPGDTGTATVTPVDPTTYPNTDVSGQLQVFVAGASSGSVTVIASGLGTTATQAYTVNPVGTTFAIVLPPKPGPFSSKTRSTASLVTTSPPTAITFIDGGVAADTITSAVGFGAYALGDTIMVGGSTSNDGVYTISSTVAPTASVLTLVASDVLTPEVGTTTVTITNGVLVRVRAPSPVASVVFATTIGVWDGGVSPIVTNTVIAVSPTLGYALAVLTSSLAGTATVQVWDAADSSTSDQITVAFSVPSANAARLTLQSNVYSVAPSIGGVTNTATLTATVRTTLATGAQVVSGAPVAFAIENPTGGGETVSPTTAITGSGGQANSTFTSGSLSTGAEGVRISAWVIGEGETLSNILISFADTNPDTIIRGDGGSFITDGFEVGEQIRVQGSASNDGFYTVSSTVAPIAGTLTLVPTDVLAIEGTGASVTIRAVADVINIVIGGTAGSVVIGRGTVIYDFNDATYRLPMSALVTDSNGNPVSGAVVTLSAWPLQYSPGVWYDQDPDPGSEYYVPWITGTFDNEDVNENLILDPGEDTDGDGQLTPPSSSAGGVPVPTSVTTDSNGVAAFDLIYLKASAVWVVTRVRARTFVVGTETTSSLTLRLPPERQQAEEGLLPDSPYPIGLTTSTTLPVTYIFPVFVSNTGVGVTALNTSIVFSAGPPATIIRADGGSFVGDGHKIGDFIKVQGSLSNNGYYTLAGVTASTLTLIAAETLTNEGIVSSATISFDDNTPSADSISRADGGSFVTDGFVAGDEIRVQGAGTPSNNGFYTLATVIAGTLTLIPADTLTDEVLGASVTITATTRGATVTITSVALSDTFSTTNLSIGCSSIDSPTRLYTYEPVGPGTTCTVTGRDAVVGDWVYDWVSVWAGTSGSTISAFAPVRTIIQ